MCVLVLVEMFKAHLVMIQRKSANPLGNRKPGAGPIVDTGIFLFFIHFSRFKRVQGLGPSATCIARYALEVAFFFLYFCYDAPLFLATKERNHGPLRTGAAVSL